tara:strand:+ start:786 stop:1202 length:417 start_codon:yes stop_codon:yes gene_type:complete
MAAVTGDSGVIKFGTVDSEAIVANVSGWSLDISMDTVDVTAMGSNAFKSFTGGKYSWTGSCEVHWDNADDTAQEGFETALLTNDSAKQVMLYPGGTGSVDYWKGVVLITGISMSGSIGDSVKLSANFQGVGALTHTNA